MGREVVAVSLPLAERRPAGSGQRPADVQAHPETEGVAGALFSRLSTCFLQNRVVDRGGLQDDVDDLRPLQRSVYSGHLRACR